MNVELANELGNLAQRTLSLIARNCGGKLPARGRLDEEDAATARRRRGAAGIVRERMDRQAFHEALEEIWKVIRAANGYIDRQAPWALEKDRSGADGNACCACWWTRSGRSRRCCSRSCRTAWRACWTSSACRPTRATLAALDDAAGRRHAAAAAGGRVPALRRRRRRSRADADRFATAISTISAPTNCRDVLARAAAAGVGEMVTIGTRLGQSPASSPRWPSACRTSGAPSASIRTTRRSTGADAGGDRGAGRASEGDRHRRIRPRLFLRQGAARRAAGEFPRAYPRRPRWPACRSRSTPATPTRTSPRSCTKSGKRAAPFAFLLHCFSSGRGLAEAALATRRLCQLLRHPDVPEIRAKCGRSRATFRPTGCWWRRIRPISRRCRSAASATSRPGSRKPPPCSPTARGMAPAALADLTTANFRRLFRKAA